LWLPVADGLAAAASFPLWVRLNKTTIDAAAAAWKAAGTTNMGGQLAKSWTFLPLSTAGQAVGLLGLGMPDGRAFDRPLDETLVATLLRQAAGAIERTNLLSEIEATRLAAQREELRSALLSSLSHDLRTPLVSILVAATSLSEFENEIDAKNRRDILKTIEDEAERLNRYVENLLNMTRISANSLKPNADWADLQDIIGAAINRIRPVSRAHVIGVALGEAPILLHVDSILLEQVFVNLLDNACKYAPPQSVITIAARMSDDTVAISVGDHGPGITADQRDRIFETFYRVNRAETSGRPGTGLGLAICRGIVLAHGGTIRAEAPPYGSGLVVVVELPRRYAALPEDRDRPSADGQD
jgi:two-component system sensor histidine kinase KdpD